MVSLHKLNQKLAEENEATVFKVKCHDIDYCVGWEDVENNFDVPEDLNDEQLDDWFEEKIDQIKSTLPEEVTLTVEATEEDLEDVVVDALSEETGWLINSYEYDII